MVKVRKRMRDLKRYWKNVKNIGEAIVAIGAGILGGIALGALLSYLLGDRCPVRGGRKGKGNKESEVHETSP